MVWCRQAPSHYLSQCLPIRVKITSVEIWKYIVVCSHIASPGLKGLMGSCSGIHMMRQNSHQWWMLVESISWWWLMYGDTSTSGESFTKGCVSGQNHINLYVVICNYSESKWLSVITEFYPFLHTNAIAKKKEKKVVWWLCWNSVLRKFWWNFSLWLPDCQWNLALVAALMVWEAMIRIQLMKIHISCMSH